MARSLAALVAVVGLLVAPCAASQAADGAVLLSWKSTLSYGVTAAAVLDQGSGAWAGSQPCGPNSTAPAWFGVTCAVRGDERRVVELVLNNLGLQGQLPASFGQLVYLQRLAMWNNQLYGGLPWGALSSLAQLHTLQLSVNQLAGQLPRVANIPPALRVLDLQYNALTGPLHPSISRHKSLVELLLTGNLLTGQLPPELPRTLELARLGRNQFAGPLPPRWSKAARLESIVLQYNAGLRGSVPASWGGQTVWPNLWELYLRPGTQICGTLRPALRSKVVWGNKNLPPCP